MNTDLAAFDRSLGFQSSIQFLTLPIKEKKTSFLEEPIEEGRPKKVPCVVTSLIPRMLDISPLVAEPTSGLNMTADFWTLTSCPDKTSYYYKILMILRASPSVASPNRTVSSAKSRCEIDSPPCPKHIPKRLPLDTAPLRRDISPSVQ
ncbi:hypothetical protein LIER_06892 [Lithospermum erythrorhizon]|uniref:Uncharacterized protein n=1 Tax=Lithospermum erythrorhizon TaxID=34254 RepID=A0AAV3P6H1_LITER